MDSRTPNDEKLEPLYHHWQSIETSQWQCSMFNIYRPPNWFWRKMQWIFFGFKWEKIR